MKGREVAVIKANEGGKEEVGSQFTLLLRLWQQTEYKAIKLFWETSHGMQYKEMGLEDVLEKLCSLSSLFPYCYARAATL